MVEVLEKKKRRGAKQGDLRINDADHPLLAVYHWHLLATIIPNRLVILDRDREGRHHARIRHRWHEA